MEIDLPIVISIVSLLVSILVFFKTRKLDIEKVDLNYKFFLSQQLQSYTDLLHQDFQSKRKEFSELSTILCRTNADIGELLDRYDLRDRKTSDKFLRHLYVDLCRDIRKEFEPQFPWQTVECLTEQLYKFKMLDIRHDFYMKNKKYYQKERFCNSEFFASNFAELTKSIDKSKYDELYSSFVDICSDLVKKLTQIKDDYSKSAEELSALMIKNSSEVFRLQHNSVLYKRYIRYKFLIQMIAYSRLDNIKKLDEVPYLPISEIIYFGSKMDMINGFILKTTSNFEE